MASINERLATIENEVTHIRPSLDKIWDKLDEVCPMIKVNNWWVKAIRKCVIALAITIPTGGVITIVLYIIRSKI